MVQSVAASKFRSSLPLESRALTPKLTGNGTREVSLSTCMTLSEHSEMSGEVMIPPPEDSSAPAKLLKFRIRRDYTRESPAGAL